MDLLPSPALLAQFALATLVIAITPGPDMTLFVGRALSAGRAAGLACMAGAMTGGLIHTVLVSLGLSALILASPAAFLALKVVGAAYLVWLAYQALRHGSAFTPDEAATPGKRPLVADWAKGVGINLLNPKIILFFMTFLPQFVSPADPQAPARLFVLGLLFIPLSLPVTIALVFAAGAVAALLKRSRRITRAIDYLFAGVFSAFAVKILTASAR